MIKHFMFSTGTRPSLSAFQHWNIQRIEPKTLRQNDDPKKRAARDVSMGTEKGEMSELIQYILFSDIC